MALIRVQAQAGASTNTRVQAGRHTVWIDEPPAFGGEDAAPSPVELLLASLAGAINAIGRYVAGELDMPLAGLDITVEGECDGACFFGKSFDRRAGFQTIRAEVTAHTAAPPETVARWREQVLRRCPVLDNLLAPAKVEVDFSVRGGV